MEPKDLTAFISSQEREDRFDFDEDKEQDLHKKTSGIDFYGMGYDFEDEDDLYCMNQCSEFANGEEVELPDVAKPRFRSASSSDLTELAQSPATRSRFAKLRQGAASTVFKAKSDLAKSMSDIGNKIKYSVIDKETEEIWNDIVALFYEQLSGMGVTKLDFIIGMILLALYYKQNVQRTSKLVSERPFVDNAKYFYRFAYGAYGWKALYSKRRGAKRHMQGLAIKAAQGFHMANMNALFKHTGLTAEDVVDVQWKSDKFSPGHYIALDHRTQNIIVAIRGTSHMHDFLVDLCGRNDEFQGGCAHAGILKCAQNKAKAFTPIISGLLEKYPNYQIKVVGHSLGGGTAALLTMILITEHPEWPIFSYCYASPCVVSKSVSDKYADKILCFALLNDPVTRVSLGSMQALKNTVAQLVLQSESNTQRVFHILNARSPDLSRKLTSWFNIKNSVLDLTKIDMNKSDAEKLVPPGKIYHLYKQCCTDTHFVMEESLHEYFTEIVVSTDMVENHFPISYEAAFESLTQNEELWQQEMAELDTEEL